MKPQPIINKNGELTGYQLRVYLGKDEKGKQKINTLTWSIRDWRPDGKYTTKQLEKELARQQMVFEDDCKKGYSKDGKISFQAYSERWLEEYAVPPTIKRKTRAGYKPLLNRINIAIGDIPIEQITPEIVNRFLLNLKNEGVKMQTGKDKPPTGLSDKSIKNYHSLLSVIFNTAVAWKYLKYSPMEGVKPPNVRRKKPKSLTSEEIERVLNSLSEASLKHQVFIEIALLTGMRNGEIAGLTWADMNFKNYTINVDETCLYTAENGIYIDTTKTPESERVLKVDKEFFDLLALYKNQCDRIKVKMQEQDHNWNKKGYLFVNDTTGKLMNPEFAYNWFTKWQKRKGLPHCSIQTLRHTHATILILKGVNEKIVSSRLGHSNTGTTTNIYDAYIKEADELSAEVVSNVIRSKKKKDMSQSDSINNIKRYRVKRII